jgi:hypothetical protein
MRSFFSVLLLIAATWAVAGCSPTTWALMPQPPHFDGPASDLAFQLKDLPGGYLVAMDRSLTAEQASYVLSIGDAEITTDLEREGFTGGHYRWYATPITSRMGSTSVFSVTILLRDSAAAKELVAALTRGLREHGADEMSVGGHMGDEARGFQKTYTVADLGGEPGDVTVNNLIFRYGNAVSVLTVHGAAHTVDPAFASKLGWEQLRYQRTAATPKEEAFR